MYEEAVCRRSLDARRVDFANTPRSYISSSAGETNFGRGDLVYLNVAALGIYSGRPLKEAELDMTSLGLDVHIVLGWN